ncbi:D-alanyl-D-alanine carboxypeptidase/D-alanyl-D-alanine-endopeptidase [Natrialba hulunbeirensis JCM 10989]|uniref:D-alanyl-D-alanine carboxypeptidase/D-alanyl-D-alanine-endopeptidase n=1 Tax=Natrialba hulunbeirensis JCM 10989 TaxID=1227493 RepID=L9ZWC9_9EURY|nr:D-alanyl-D-alanine carboxypeptidase/D-alanyl-D-alanine-endopeptidase [Natrialba hulunbeirensis]ELY90639.1 D-alanyl-D-alanine carboxypeptidase/D-alanyl-D-alanine-endopeptidase [Natrialba hulunbeirensis JCM 10989]
MFSALTLDRRRFVQATGLTAVTGLVAGSQASAADEAEEEQTQESDQEQQAGQSQQTQQGPPVDAGDVFDHLDQAAISVFARDIETGDVIADSGSERPVQPASTTKLLTTAAAFDELGPDYRYETTVGVVGDRRNQRVVESLGVVASGDPDLTASDLEALAAAVADAGIERVTDRLVVDVSAFDDGEYPPGWTLGDAVNTYGSKSSAFVVNHNEAEVTVSRQGDDCEFEHTVEPDSGLVDVEIELECVDSDRFVTITTPNHWTNTAEVNGRMVPDDEATASVPVATPNEHAARVFARALADEGVEITPGGGGPEPEIEISDEPIEFTEEVTTHESVPLSDIAEGLNHWSYNMVAENIARTVAYEREGTGNGSWSVWESYLDETLAAAGAETPQIRDGSGLSRHDLASARDAVSMIEWALDADWGEEFYGTMAVAGEDGTLRNRLGDVDATIRAKTGSLRGVTCLAGVIEDDGEPATSFAVLAANLTGERANGASPRVDELVTAIAEESG